MDAVQRELLGSYPKKCLKEKINHKSSMNRQLLIRSTRLEYKEIELFYLDGFVYKINKTDNYTLFFFFLVEIPCSLAQYYQY